MSQETSIYLANENASKPFAASWFSVSHAPFVIYLEGDLGSGKTTFARAFLRAAGFSGSVKSPTYNLLEIYPIEQNRILHFDLYRLNSPLEWEEAGFDDEIDNNSILLIEWPEKGEDFVAKADIKLTFSLHKTGRLCTITPCGTKGRNIFQQWQKLQDDIS